MAKFIFSYVKFSTDGSRLRSELTLFINVAFLFATSHFASASSSPTLGYSVDGWMDMIESADLSSKSETSTDLLKIESKPNSARTLGLSRLKLGLSTAHESRGGFSIALRPDYQNYSKVNDSYFDFDPRSGSPYRKQPEIKLLDSYIFYVDPIEQASLQVGVFDRLADVPLAYPDFLGFTGQVQFPSKYSGFSLNWSNTRTIPTVASPDTEATFSASLTVFQGDQDRSETYSQSTRSNDSGPESRDRHLHLALHGRYKPISQLHFKLMAGGGRSHLSAGKVMQNFVHLLSDFEFKIIQTTLVLSVDLRREHESFNIPEKNSPDLIQQSHEIRSSVRFKPETWALLSLRHGTSDRHNSAFDEKIFFQFLQAEVGVLHSIHADLMVATLFSQEKQTQRNAQGVTSGALGEPNKDRSSQKRFIVSLRYALDRRR